MTDTPNPLNLLERIFRNTLAPVLSLFFSCVDVLFYTEEFVLRQRGFGKMAMNSVMSEF